MKISYTDDPSTMYGSVFVYGLSGSGKTPLAATLNPKTTVVVTSEPGLKSLRSIHMPVVYGFDHKSSLEVLAWLKSSSEAKSIVNVYYDSASALSETILNAELAKSSDARKYSPNTYNKTMEIVMGFLSLTTMKRNVIMTSKAIKGTQTIQIMESGLLQERSAEWIDPYAAVPKLGPALPYHFDDVLYLSRHRDPATGQEYAKLTCRANDLCIARNRGGMLDLWEPANLSHILTKNGGVC